MSREWTPTRTIRPTISPGGWTASSRATSPGSRARRPARYGFYRAKPARRHPASRRRSLWLPPALVATGLTAALAPRPLRSAACAGLLVYAATLVAASARAAEGDIANRAALPLVF